MVNPLQPPRSPSLAATRLLDESPIHSPVLSASPLQAPSRCLSPLSPPRSLAPPPVEDLSWRDGDFELVSSDNVRFRVQAYHLFSASTVLRSAGDMDDDSRRKVIHFADEDMETASVIRSFLRLITTGQVATTADGSGTPSVAALRRLILFLRKWDCPVALQLVLFKCKELLSQGISIPMYTFILGATADDIDTCSMALKYLTQSWNGPSGHTDVRSEGTPGAATIDPTNLPYSLWQWVPQDYMWALARSWGKYAKDGTRLPDEFKRVIQLIKGSHKHTTSL